MRIAAVADAGPLIHLAEIDSLELLSVLDQLHVPETVYDEVESGGIPSDMESLSYERVSSEDLDAGYGELDPGETAALAVADEYGAVLLTDDLAARDVAKEIDVEVHGSLGIIAFAYAQGLLERDEAADRMRALQHETSLFITDAVVERGIDMLDANE